MTDINSRTNQTHIRTMVTPAAKKHVAPNTKRLKTKKKSVQNHFLGLEKYALFKFLVENMKKLCCKDQTGVPVTFVNIKSSKKHS